MTFTHQFNSWQRNPDGKPRCIVLRWGAIGDMLVAASVLPGLRKQGYHVTVHTTAGGAEILKNNPNVHEIIVSDRETIRTAEANDYFNRLNERYDKIVNLDFSLEGLLLCRPENIAYHYPDTARKELFNRNYLETAHLIADVPFDFRSTFYPTPAEAKWAIDGRKGLANEPVVLWAATGSSLNKIYPWVNVVAGWLVKAGVNVIFAGGPGPANLIEHSIIKTIAEDGGDTTRLYPRTGKWTLRQSLTFAQCASDVVIGPETGLLHGVAMHDVPKVIYLSHSSEENLTKHWANTTALTPEDCPCYPCHRIHESWDYCNFVEETHAALCASQIPPEELYDAIMDSFPEEHLNVAL